MLLQLCPAVCSSSIIGVAGATYWFVANIYTILTAQLLGRLHYVFWITYIFHFIEDRGKCYRDTYSISEHFTYLYCRPDVVEQEQPIHSAYVPIPAIFLQQNRTTETYRVEVR